MHFVQYVIVGELQYLLSHISNDDTDNVYLVVRPFDIYFLI